MPILPQKALNPGVRRRELFGWAMHDFASAGHTGPRRRCAGRPAGAARFSTGVPHEARAIRGRGSRPQICSMHVR